jgi:hypothetical protein
MTAARKDQPSINEAPILILASDGHERSELRVPYEKLQTLK